MLLCASIILRLAKDLCRQTLSGGGVFRFDFVVVSLPWGGSRSTA